MLSRPYPPSGPLARAFRANLRPQRAQARTSTNHPSGRTVRWLSSAAPSSTLIRSSEPHTATVRQCGHATMAPRSADGSGDPGRGTGLRGPKAVDAFLILNPFPAGERASTAARPGSTDRPRSQVIVSFRLNATPIEADRGSRAHRFVARFRKSSYFVMLRWSSSRKSWIDASFRSVSPS